MRITRETHLHLTNEELITLEGAKEILGNICFNCCCDEESCPLYKVCAEGGNTSLTIEEALGYIIKEATPE